MQFTEKNYIDGKLEIEYLYIKFALIKKENKVMKMNDIKINNPMIKYLNNKLNNILIKIVEIL